jgi:hypothetical protein
MKKIPPEYRPFLYIGFAFLLVVIFYYTFSPYQNCVRVDDVRETQLWCAKHTAW